MLLSARALCWCAFPLRVEILARVKKSIPAGRNESHEWKGMKYVAHECRDQQISLIFVRTSLDTAFRAAARGWGEGEGALEGVGWVSSGRA